MQHGNIHGRHRKTSTGTARKRWITGVAGLGLTATLGFLPTTSANAEPDIDDVQARVDSLYHEAEQASERYNDAKIELDSLTKDLKGLKADRKRQSDELDEIRDNVSDAVVRQYEGQDIALAGQVALSDDPDAFLSRLATAGAYQNFQDQLFAEYSTEIKALGIRTDATEKRAAEIAEVKDRLADEKKEIDAKADEAKALLSRLKEKEREEILSRGGSATPPSDVPAAGRAKAAIDYAMAQVGDAYVWGAAGPSAFDCSGLMMAAWAQAGVSLPHSSSAQSGVGTRVSTTDLQPGDLVFYYSPISHVGMYIGNGLIVHAANPGAGVKVSPVGEMPISGATRVG